MGSFSIRLFGRFSVYAEDKPLDELEVGKVKELFSYLLLHRQFPQRRETLATLLWAQATTSQSKRYLSKAVWQLQSLLTPYENDGVSTLIVESEWIQINACSPLWLDISVFEEAFETTKHLMGEQLSCEQVELLSKAIKLHRGELLEGCYEDWCIIERERLQFLYLTMLDKLMMYFESKQEYELMIEYGQKILRHDRARERTHRRLMRAYYLADDRTGAIRQFERCRSLLQDELQVTPGRRTQLLFEEICQDGPASREIVDTHHNTLLRSLQQRLAHIQSQLQHEIDRLEQLS